MTRAEANTPAEATYTRIVGLAANAGHSVRIDEVAHVVAGDIVPPRRRVAQEMIRRAAIHVDAARPWPG